MLAVISGYRRKLWAFVKPSMRRGHLTYIDGARAIAALYVVLHHCYQWLGTLPLPPDVAPSPFWEISRVLSEGRFAVSAFIAISGFSLMLPVVRDDGKLLIGAWTFFKRRARRILPTYYFALGLSLAVIWLLSGHYGGREWTKNLPATGPIVISHLLLLHDVDTFATYGINGPLWSIALEWHIYFAFPLLVLLARRVRMPVLAAVMIVLCWLGVRALVSSNLKVSLAHAQILGNPVLRFFPGNFPLLIDFLGLFVIGMFGATLAYAPQPFWARLRARVPWGVLALVSTVAYIAMFARFGSSLQALPRSFYADVASAVLVVILFNWAAASERSLGRRILGWRPLATVGTFAYSIYLIHVPILGMVSAFVMYPFVYPALHPDSLGALGLFILIAVPVVVVVAYIFFLFCERPFLNPPASAQKARAGVVAAQLASAPAS